MKKAIVILIIVMLSLVIIGCERGTRTDYQSPQAQQSVGGGCSVSEPQHSSSPYIDRINMKL